MRERQSEILRRSLRRPPLLLQRHNIAGHAKAVQLVQKRHAEQSGCQPAALRDGGADIVGERYHLKLSAQSIGPQDNSPPLFASETNTIRLTFGELCIAGRKAELISVSPLATGGAFCEQVRHVVACS